MEYSAAGIISVMLPGDENPVLETDCSADKGAEGLKNAEKAGALLRRYFDGEIVDFTPVRVDLAGRSPFFRQVCEIVGKTGYGHVATYGQIAELAGKKGGARAVGRVMATNPVPIIIPCHRVVAADGRLTGYSAAGGIDTKKELLQMEGIDVFTDDRVKMTDR